MQPTSTTSSIHHIDLSELTERILHRYSHQIPTGYLPGKTAIRDIVVSMTPIPITKAEMLVGEMERRGFIAYAGDPQQVDHAHLSWSLNPTPLCVS